MDEYMSRARVWEFTCPGRSEEVSRVRRWTRDILTGSPQADDAALIVTELATNALLHSSSGRCAFHVTVTRSPRTLAISVTDAGGKPGAPRVEAPDETEPHGRGLGLVSALADRLRIRGDEKSGHTVTAELQVVAPDLSLSGANPATEIPAC
ncbi:ATP-binding protein [Streptomyces sp. HNM0574]|uniref:ATP-binding protein n=1 Tax=Streptomyces sp. HNM0574 TaxID=2714954 RepID=UPI00146C1932|nr:ATP-binding protein [Streptomyces sp. HNM0574]NLU66754.1 ATP-binding protein [Streptomyces sp. HNM0574]